jgi:uncharacterized membrane protein YwzB
MLKNKGDSDPIYVYRMFKETIFSKTFTYTQKQSFLQYLVNIFAYTFVLSTIHCKIIIHMLIFLSNYVSLKKKKNALNMPDLCHKESSTQPMMIIIATTILSGKNYKYTFSDTILQALGKTSIEIMFLFNNMMF